MRINVFTILLLLLTSVSTFSQKDWVSGELIVQLENEFDQNNLIEAIKNKNPKIGLNLKEILVPSLNVFLFDFNENEIEIDKLISKLDKTGITKTIQKNHTNIDVRKTANDPNTIGQWYLDKINAPVAWETSTGGLTVNNQEIVVAIVDLSFEITHDDLKANFWKNKHEIPLNNIDDDNNGYIDDYDGWNVYEDTGYISARQPGSTSISSHGTSVAGIIGAVGNNGRDIAGINWDIKMLPIQGSSTNESIVIKSYNYILEMRKKYNRTNGDSGAFIIAQNSSFGVDKKFPSDFPIWCNLIDELGKEGVVSIAAGPNKFIDIDIDGDIPCTCPSDYLVAVAMSNENDGLNASGYGKINMDIAAPGKSILSTVPSNKTGSSTGASFAGPMVSAGLGLMYASYPERFYNYSPDSMALLSALFIKESVEKLEAFESIISSGGRLDLEKAVGIAKDLSLSTPEKYGLNLNTLAVYPNPTSGKITFSQPIYGMVKIYSIRGNLVFSQENYNQTKVNLGHLDNGVYLLKVKHENEQIHTKIILRK